MGGGLALVLACQRPDKVTAVVSYYGVMPDPDQVDVAGIKAAVQGHFATADGFMPVDAANAIERKLEDAGADVQFHYYEAGHAFANDDDPIGTFHEEHARTAWVRTLEFLRAHLG